MRKSNAVTKDFLHKFKVGELVDVRGGHVRWNGPHKLLVYKINPARNGATPAAYIVIDLGEKKLERWLMVGDQQIIRRHIP